MPRTLLVVDDSITIQEAARLALTGEDWHVVGAASGAEALERLRSHLPDAVLCAASLGDEDGYAVCRSIRATAEGSSIPVILSGAEVDESAALEAGAAGALPKPFSSEELADTLRATLDGGLFDPGPDEVEPAAPPGPGPVAPTPEDLGGLGDEFLLSPEAVAQPAAGDADLGEQVEVIDLAGEDEFGDLELLDDLQPVAPEPVDTGAPDLAGDTPETFGALDLGPPEDEAPAAQAPEPLDAGAPEALGELDLGPLVDETPAAQEPVEPLEGAEAPYQDAAPSGTDEPLPGAEAGPAAFPAGPEEEPAAGAAGASAGDGWAAEPAGEAVEPAIDAAGALDEPVPPAAVDGTPEPEAQGEPPPDGAGFDSLFDDVVSPAAGASPGEPEPASAPTGPGDELRADSPLAAPAEPAPDQPDAAPSGTDPFADLLAAGTAGEPDARPRPEPPLPEADRAPEPVGAPAFEPDVPAAEPAGEPDQPAQDPSWTGEPAQGQGTQVWDEEAPPYGPQRPAAAADPVEQTVRKALEQSLSAEALTPVVQATVERVVWEVVPQLAERLIQEAIERLQKEAPPPA